MNYMTVGDLRSKITGLADDVIITVACENRCDPHPVYGGYFTPTIRQAVNSRNRDNSKNETITNETITIVQIWQNENIDISHIYEYDDE